MVKEWVLGLFTDPQSLLQAVRSLQSEKIPIGDVYTPYALHELDELLVKRPSRLPWVTFIAALAGLILAMSFQFWTSAFDWPVNVGGKPINSTLAYIPVAFEITILSGALITVAAFLFRSGLFFGNKKILPHLGVTDDLFVIVIENNAALPEKKACDLLKKNGASLLKKSVTV